MRLWERQKNEPPKAFAAFVVYRDMGPRRSLVRVADAWAQRNAEKQGSVRRGVKNGRIAIWSSRYEWLKRALAWDANLERERERQIVAALADDSETWRARLVCYRDGLWTQGTLIQQEAENTLARLANSEAGPTPMELRHVAMAMAQAAALRKAAIDSHWNLNAPGISDGSGTSDEQRIIDPDQAAQQIANGLGDFGESLR